MLRTSTVYKTERTTTSYTLHKLNDLCSLDSTRACDGVISEKNKYTKICARHSPL